MTDHDERIAFCNWVQETIGLITVAIGSGMAWGVWEMLAAVGFALVIASRR